MAYWTRTKGAKRESYRKRRTRIENVRVDATSIIFTLATGVEYYFELTHDGAARLCRSVVGEYTTSPNLSAVAATGLAPQ